MPPFRRKGVFVGVYNGLVGGRGGLQRLKAVIVAGLICFAVRVPDVRAAIACNATAVPCSGKGVCDDGGVCNCNMYYFRTDCSENVAKELGAVWTVWMLVWIPYIVMIVWGIKYLRRRFSGRSFKKVPVNKREWLVMGNMLGCALRLAWGLDPKALWWYSRGAEIMLLRGTRGAKPSNRLRCVALGIGSSFFAASAVLTIGAASTADVFGNKAHHFYMEFGNLVEALYIAVLIPIGIIYAVRLLRVLDRHSSSQAIISVMRHVFNTITIVVVVGVLVILFVSLELILQWHLREGEPKTGATVMLFVIHVFCEPVFAATILYVSTAPVKKDGQQRGAVSMSQIGVKGSRQISERTSPRSRGRGSSSEGQVSTVNPISEFEAASTAEIPAAHILSEASIVSPSAGASATPRDPPVGAIP